MNTRLSLVGGTARDPGVDSVLASAQREVLVLSTGGAVAFGRVDRDNLRRGVRYRVLVPDSVRLSGKVTALAAAGAEVRTETAVPMDALVVDGTTALLPGPHTGVAAFRLTSVVAATTALFDRMWPAAVPLVPAEPVEHREALSPRERDLLALLWSGATDDSAAARLGISVRTVRRMVSDIMNRLGARSRFQAGAKAADRGWLMDRAG
ncbi:MULTISPECIES: helix-turn-helix transcriptional regulator [unclassified Saccharothrix]|uniref:helix-turn-helix transcriptional regulator n=1 Tax=unclassified Saccharothrix TaxID=2593673 RepID=UPI00307D693A